MKSLKLIESRNVDNDVAETLLPTLSDKMMNEVTGGLSCLKKYEDGPISCGAKFTINVCAMDLACGSKFTFGPIECKDTYADVRPCNYN